MCKSFTGGKHNNDTASQHLLAGQCPRAYTPKRQNSVPPVQKRKGCPYPMWPSREKILPSHHVVPTLLLAIIWSTQVRKCISCIQFIQENVKAITFKLSVKIKFHFHRLPSCNELFETRPHMGMFRQTLFFNKFDATWGNFGVTGSNFAVDCLSQLHIYHKHSKVDYQ